MGALFTPPARPSRLKETGLIDQLCNYRARIAPHRIKAVDVSSETNPKKRPLDAAFSFC